jgi:hypothetical protein
VKFLPELVFCDSFAPPPPDYFHVIRPWPVRMDVMMITGVIYDH